MNDRAQVWALATALLVAGCVGAAATTASAQPVFDHMKCYKIKDSLKSKWYTADLDPELTHDFAAELGDRIVGGFLQKGCRIKAPASYFCISVDTVNAHEANPPYNATSWTVAGPNAGERLCYKLTCPAVAPKQLDVIDQFGSRPITLLGRTQYLCEPANRAIEGNQPCSLAGNGQCGGTCTNGDVCLATSTQDCGCVPPSEACAQSLVCSEGKCGGVWETCVSLQGGICGCSHPPS